MRTRLWSVDSRRCERSDGAAGGVEGDSADWVSMTCFQYLLLVKVTILNLSEFYLRRFAPSPMLLF